MDEKLQRQLLRQLKLINFWISLYGAIMVITIAIIAYMLFQMMAFARDTNDRIDSLKSSVSDSVNVTSKACGGSGPVTDWLKSQTDFCQ